MNPHKQAFQMMEDMLDENSLPTDQKKQAKTGQRQRLFDSCIAIAADSLAKLRKCDVYRVLSEAPADDRAALADYIITGRPDLSSEVSDVLDELFGR